MTVSASEEETHYVQSTSVALDSDLSQNSRARRGTSRARRGTRKKAQRVMSRSDTSFRSVSCRPVTHSHEAHSQCESRPERNVIKLKNRIALFVEFRKMRGSRKLSARNRVCTHITHFYIAKIKLNQELTKLIHQILKSNVLFMCTLKIELDGVSSVVIRFWVKRGYSNVKKT